MNKPERPARTQRQKAQAAELVARRRKRRGIFVGPVGQTVRCLVHGTPILFTVVNPRDEIQKHHLQGGFYEPEELAIIARHFPVGGRFCDIGSNIGNHTLYVAKFLHASRIVVFEPNPSAIAILEANIELNGIEAVVDRSHLGIGLSDQASVAHMRVPARNLGGSRVVEGAGDIPLNTVDALIEGQAFDLIKIDVEGMELRVLSGMSALLKQCRPRIFIEVDQENQPGFMSWLDEAGYQVLEQFQRYARNTNYLIGPATAESGTGLSGEP